MAESVDPLASILRAQAPDSEADLYIKSDLEAVRHFFRVAAGLDSQIPGDYEIIGQIRSQFATARDERHVDGLLEKLFNCAVRVSKEVKNTTLFSDGTLSVQYAVAREVIQLGLDHVVILGAGDTALITAKYLRKMNPRLRLSIVNRDQRKLELFTERYNARGFVMADLSCALKDAQALVITTNAPHLLVRPHHLQDSLVKHIYDLSVPSNLDPVIKTQINLRILDVDTISAALSVTLSHRSKEIPKVEALVIHHTNEFRLWLLRNHFYSVAHETNLTSSDLKQILSQWLNESDHDISESETIRKSARRAILQLTEGDESLKFRE